MYIIIFTTLTCVVLVGYLNDAGNILNEQIFYRKCSNISLKCLFFLSTPFSLFSFDQIL